MAEVENIPFPELPPFHRQLYDAFVALGIGKGHPLDELRAQMGLQPHEQQQMRKRISELNAFGFDAKRVSNRGRVHLYALLSTDPVRPSKSPHDISAKLRAQILHRANGRCQMCGRGVAEHGVVLVVDHKVPRDWGGSNEESNLWAICEDCNGGKKSFFASLPQDIMAKCMAYADATQRLGELLKAFADQPPPRWLLKTVALDEDDWPRRLRELRDLGWEYRVTRDHEGRTSYRLVESKPWPPDVREAIRQAAEKRGSKSYK